MTVTVRHGFLLMVIFHGYVSHNQMVSTINHSSFSHNHSRTERELNAIARSTGPIRSHHGMRNVWCTDLEVRFQSSG